MLSLVKGSVELNCIYLLVIREGFSISRVLFMTIERFWLGFQDCEESFSRKCSGMIAD